MMGNTFAECRAASRCTASTLNALGIQDAPHKRREPSMTPGAWAGSIVASNDDSVALLVSQERWETAQKLIEWIYNSIASSPQIEFKTLESYQGYLIYLCRTYSSINPHLKGIHLTLDSWRPWRREDGWKMTISEMHMAILEKEGYDTLSPLTNIDHAPKYVSWVPRL